MPISFAQIPNGLRDPGVYIERDNSMALRGLPAYQAKIYLIGQKLAAGTATVETPVLVNSVEQAKALFGRGSQLAHMLETFKLNTRYVETWAVPLADVSGGTQATGKLTFGGTATTAGTVHVYIAGREIRAAVSVGDDDEAVSAAVVAAINANGDLPVTAAVDGTDANEANLTARHKGTLGNGIDVQLNYYGAENGQALPAGITCTVTAMASGATDPDYQDAIDGIPDQLIDHFILGTNSATEVAKFETEIRARRTYDKQLYGFAWYAKNDTVGNLGTYGNARNFENASCFGIYKTPTPFWEVAAAYLGCQVISLLNDPARPTQTLVLQGVLPPPPAFEFNHPERDALLYDGIAPAKVVNGQVTITRAITTYQKNASESPDPSYLDSETIFTNDYIERSTIDMFERKYPRHKLAQNGTRFGAGQPVMTPNIARAELVAHFSLLEEVGLVEDAEQYKNDLIAEVNGTDPNRLDVMNPPNLVNQLRVIAMKNQFRL